MFVPTELEVCFSTECNMNCKYCYYRMDKQPHRTLPWKKLKAGLDQWLSVTAPEKTFDLGTELSVARKVDFAGREPFFHYEILEKAVNYLRRKAGKSLEIGVYTNGSFLNRKNVSFLLKRDVKIAVSLDGVKKINDLNRVFIDRPEKSVFDNVTANLRKLTPNMRSKLLVSPTFTSETISHLPESVACFLKLGFGEISLGLDMFELWDKKGMKRLREALRRMKSDYKKRLMAGNWPYNATCMFPVYFPDLKKRCAPRVSDEIALGYDGYFYPCTVPALGPESRKTYRIGDFQTGIDLFKLKRELTKIDSIIGKNGVSECAQCSVGGFFDCKMRKNSTRVFFKSAKKVSDIFREELGGIILANDTLNAMAQDGKFGDLDHLPARKSDKKIAAMTLDAGHGEGKGPLSLSAMREGVDLALYSPGKEKEIRLETNDPAKDCDRIFVISVYALMKSEKLDKKIRLIIRAGGNHKYEKRLINFIREHNIFLEIVHDAKKISRLPAGILPEFATVILKPEKKPVKWETILKRLSRDKFISFGIEPAAPEYKELSYCLNTLLKQVKNSAISKPVFLSNLEVFLKKNKTQCPFERFLRLKANGVYMFSFDSNARFIGKNESGFDDYYAKCSFSPKSRECAKCAAGIQANQIMPANDKFLSDILKKIIFRANGKYLKAMLKRKQTFSGLFAGNPWSEL